MDYDFAGMCADQSFDLGKKLSALNKKFIKEYKAGLNLINNPVANEKRGEIITGVEDHLRDVVGKCSIFYTEALNKVQRELIKYL